MALHEPFALLRRDCSFFRVTGWAFGISIMNKLECTDAAVCDVRVDEITKSFLEAARSVNFEWKGSSQSAFEKGERTH